LAEAEAAVGMVRMVVQLVVLVVLELLFSDILCQEQALLLL